MIQQYIFDEDSSPYTYVGAAQGAGTTYEFLYGAAIYDDGDGWGCQGSRCFDSGVGNGTGDGEWLNRD